MCLMESPKGANIWFCVLPFYTFVLTRLCISRLNLSLGAMDGVLAVALIMAPGWRLVDSRRQPSHLSSSTQHPGLVEYLNLSQMMVRWMVCLLQRWCWLPDEGWSRAAHSLAICLALCNIRVYCRLILRVSCLAICLALCNIGVCCRLILRVSWGLCLVVSNQPM